MDLGLSERVYVLTGATRGLGRATAELLLSEGARVVLSGRSEEHLADARSALGEDRVAAVRGDNADPALADRLVAAARDTWGRLDGALVSVGGPPAGPLMESREDDWRSSFESVFLGGLRVARAVADAAAEGGSIAFVLSSSVKQPLSGLAISNGLRPGLAMLAKNLADELGPRGIRVNGLLPGRIATERVRELDEGTGDAQAAYAQAVSNIPLGRYGRPEEFAAAAAFLLSRASSFVNGVMLPVDGGMLRSL